MNKNRGKTIDFGRKIHKQPTILADLLGWHNVMPSFLTRSFQNHTNICACTCNVVRSDSKRLSDSPDSLHSVLIYCMMWFKCSMESEHFYLSVCLSLLSSCNHPVSASHFPYRFYDVRSHVFIPLNVYFVCCVVLHRAWRCMRSICILVHFNLDELFIFVTNAIEAL